MSQKTGEEDSTFPCYVPCFAKRRVLGTIFTPEEVDTTP